MAVYGDPHRAQTIGFQCVRDHAVAPAVLDELRDVVGGAQVLTDDDVTQRYRTDWTRRYQAPNATVVRPGSTAEVAACVEIARRHRLAVVPQGGNTGLVGGSVPLDGELVVSTERLTDLGEVTAGGEVTVGAGVTLEALQRHAARAGWEYAVDIASRATATVGGTIATNAGGLRVVAHGDTRRQVRGVEVVTGAAEVLAAMPAALRDNTGYHLPSLFCGSEGTLGILTAAQVRLRRPTAQTATALLGFATVHAAAQAAETLRHAAPPVAAIEFFTRSGLELVCTVFDWPDPLDTPAAAYVLVEVASGDAADDLADVVADLADITASAVALDTPTRARLWRYREHHTEAISTRGVPHKLDIAVPPGALGTFLDRVPAAITAVAPDATVWLFGHGGEGSVHVNVTGLAPDDLTVDDTVLRLVADLGGSISAEHGIGRTKLPWLSLAKTDVEVRALTRLKAAFDPDHIMNPAVLLP